MLKSVFNLLRLPLTERVCIKTLPIQAQGNNVKAKFMHLTSIRSKMDRRALLATAIKKDDGSQGEKVIDIDNIFVQSGLFPDVNTPNKLFNGIPFKEIPIIDVKCSPNNTIMTLSKHDGAVQLHHSCGTEGFKHARKATNIAAQATAISLSSMAMAKGFKTVRVRVRGLGPGRMSALKGLQMGGMEIISVTDNTRVTWTPLRPRKPKRL